MRRDEQNRQDLWLWLVASAYGAKGTQRARLVEALPNVRRMPRQVRELIDGLVNNDKRPIRHWLEQRDVRLNQGERVVDAIARVLEHKDDRKVFNEKVAYLRGSTLPREELIAELHKAIAILERNDVEVEKDEEPADGDPASVESDRPAGSGGDSGPSSNSSGS